MDRVFAAPGMTLFHLAAKHLGDATQWTRIAAVNNIQDPFLVHAINLSIPARQSQAA